VRSINIIVQYPDGVTTLSEGTGPGTYAGITNSSKIIIDLTDCNPSAGTTVRVILTSGIQSFANPSVTLQPVNTALTVD